MRIAVCIKQVPLVSALQLDPETHTLTRDGVPNEISAFDTRALLKAVDLVATHGGEVVVLTMGPPQARDALSEALALGANAAIHLCDRVFAGADTLATSHALAAALAPHAFDLILCGRNSVDAETGQVGPEIAEILALPQVTNARSLEFDRDRGVLRAEREVDDGTEVVEVPTPALVSAAEDLAPERFASAAERDATATKPYTALTASDLSPDNRRFGKGGSPTWVDRLEVVRDERRRQLFDGDIAAGAENVARVLVDDHGLFGVWRDGTTNRPEPSLSLAQTNAGPVWVIADERDGDLRDVTLELLGKARELAALATTTAAVVFTSDPTAFAPTLAAYGADRILYSSACKPPVGRAIECCAAQLAAAITAEQPSVVLAPATTFGRDLMPRVAARLGLGLTGDCIDVAFDQDGRLVQYKPAFGGSVVAPILSATRPQMATLRPGMLALPAPREAMQVPLVDLPAIRNGTARVTVLEHRRHAAAATGLERATNVVGLGMGLGSWERSAVVHPLVDILDAAICTTRDVCEAGWLPKQHQVGITGRAIAPRLYIAIGIRGAFEHMVGVRRAGVIVGINKSAKAPLFKSCDYGIVGDFAQVVPALEQALRARRGP